MSDTGSDGAGKTSRRGFLKGVMVVGGVAALGALARNAVADAQPEPAAPASTPEAKGYHVTQHIRDYYRTARS